MKKSILFSLISSLVFAVHATQAAAPRAEDLILAAARNDAHTIQNLIDAGVDVNAKGPNGVTALMKAIESGHLDVVKILLAAEGIDVNAQNDRGTTALMYAGADEVPLLLAAEGIEGIDVNAQDTRGVTALMHAAEGGNAFIVRLLLAVEGINVNTQDHFGYTALHLATQISRTDIIEALLDADADPTIKNDEGETAANLAITNEIRTLLTTPRAKAAR